MVQALFTSPLNRTAAESASPLGRTLSADRAAGLGLASHAVASLEASPSPDKGAQPGQFQTSPATSSLGDKENDGEDGEGDSDISELLSKSGMAVLMLKCIL